MRSMAMEDFAVVAFSFSPLNTILQHHGSIELGDRHRRRSSFGSDSSVCDDSRSSHHGGGSRNETVPRSVKHSFPAAEYRRSTPPAYAGSVLGSAELFRSAGDL